MNTDEVEVQRLVEEMLQPLWAGRESDSFAMTLSPSSGRTSYGDVADMAQEPEGSEVLEGRPSVPTDAPSRQHSEDESVEAGLAAGLMSELEKLIAQSRVQLAEDVMEPEHARADQALGSAAGSSALSQLAGFIPQAAKGSNPGEGLISWLNPWAAGILRAFSGSDEGSTVEDSEFAWPDRQSIDFGYREDSPDMLISADHGQTDDVRASSNRPSQVVVQVQALDSQSFMDRAPEIASAVRRMLLESGDLAQILREG